MTDAIHSLQLTRRPRGVPGADDFRLTREPLPAVGEGEALVENRYLSVDPYMRGRMNDAPSYFPPWDLDAPLDGEGIGIVVTSCADGLPEGSWVSSEFGFQDRLVAPAEKLRPLAPPPAGLDYSCYLDILGGTGFTAYLGTMDIIEPAPGKTIFVSTAAGSVGSIAGQICKAEGARVIGSTSSAAKIALAAERYGFDAVFNYREEGADEALARLAPEGLDGFFDNVGGEQLEAAIEHMKVGGRIAKCGAIEGYNTTDRSPGPRNLHLFFGRRLSMIGFLVTDHAARRPQFEERMRGWIERRAVSSDQRVFHGLEQVPAAFEDLFSGGNVGKTVIALDPVPAQG
ncbi:MAG: NADP-dependent oxidoreductase [Actinobacteria bacterium]|nr:NADP-dependent oxidoreductase [Actinomycetota bacterium]